MIKNLKIIKNFKMEHQNWDYTVYSKGKGSEKGDKAVNKAMRDGKEVETLKKGSQNVDSLYFL